MSSLIENSMYTVAQLFLLPTLALIALLFLYAFWVLGAFVVQACAGVTAAAADRCWPPTAPPARPACPRTNWTCARTS